MKKFLKYFRNHYAEEHLNLPLAKRQLEAPLHEFILDVFASLEKTGFVKLIASEHITDESKIDYSKYIKTRRRKTRRADKDVRLMDMHYDRCSLLIMKFRAEAKGEVGYKTLHVLIPKTDKNGFMCIKSKQVYLLYQLVNNSTYVTKNSITLKGMMGLCINRQPYAMVDTNLREYKFPIYKILNFQKEFNPLMLFAAKMGMMYALEKFDVARVLSVVDANTPEEDGYTYFFVKTNDKKPKDTEVKIKVVTRLFEKYIYLRSMTGILYLALSAAEKPTAENINDRNFWLDELGYLYTEDRGGSREIGKSTLVFFERLVDKGTQKVLKMFDHNKYSVYNLTVTLIQNFDEFKKKDNNDISTNRLRLRESISALTSIRMGNSVNRILSLGTKVQLSDVMDMLKVPPNIILRALYKSQLIKYNDIVNDMDFFNGFKYTIKGPQAIGKSTDRKVTARDRGVAMSSIGKIDPDVCSSSSPGLGGLVSPFAKTDGLFFDGKQEVQDSAFDLIKESDKYTTADVTIETPDTYEEFLKRKERFRKESSAFAKIIIPEEDDDVIHVYIEEDEE